MDLYNIRRQLNMGIPLTSLHLRVTDYSRVSTNHLEQQKSLQHQIDHFDEMIKNNNNWIYVKGYVDEGISGTTDYKRNNFMRMIEDAKNNQFDLIITKEISRFSRNTLDSIKYTRELLSYGVAVLFVNDNINTALPDAELRLTIMASMAQDEIRRLSERVKFGMYRSIKNGTILGNRIYGYQKNKLTNSLEIVKEEALIIKKIYHMYTLNHYSLSKIATILNNESNKNWTTTTISRIIKNPKYKGYYCGKKTEIIDYMTKKVRYLPSKEWIIYKDKEKIPPIINELLWNKANERLKNRTINSYKERYPLSAKIYCQFDNSLYHRRKQCSNDITWTCAKHLQEGKNSCPNPSLRESEIYYILTDIFTNNIDLSKVLNILLNIYHDIKLKPLIIQELNNNKLIDKLINILLNKIEVLNTQKKDYISLRISINIPLSINKEYLFKRGYHTSNTRRYFIKYHIEIS